MKFKPKKIESTLILWFFVLVSCHAQPEGTAKQAANKLVGGRCEGCEAIFEYNKRSLTSSDTLPLFQTSEPKLKISGTVFRKDGKTPAGDVILYIYHTNRKGIYENKGDEKGWAKRHGFIRGWIKTDHDGRYTFYTFRPASYPGGTEPEHIHITVKEPDKNEYYLDDFVFDDDPILTAERRRSLRDRGGSGIVKPTLSDELLSINRDIILGLNIPDYD
jgi:protocatechuate 3,4-dioxygenase beta subunit